MDATPVLSQIREKERQSHIQIYSQAELFQEGSWLHKPVSSVMDVLPELFAASGLRILDLGCGIGRNSIPIAARFREVPCVIECVDILELAIGKLQSYAELHQVGSRIRAIHCPIDAYPIDENSYDFIFAVSALEHMDSPDSLAAKLWEIEHGVKENGFVCFVINSEVREENDQTGEPLIPQFEINLPADILLQQLSSIFSRWEIRKLSVREQQYRIPRGCITSLLQTKVITFAAKKTAIT